MSAYARCVVRKAFIRCYPAGSVFPVEVKSLQKKCGNSGKSVRGCFEGKNPRGGAYQDNECQRRHDKNGSIRVQLRE